MQKRIGFAVAHIGAKLWENNGFWKVNDYDKLSIIGKFGYNLFCKGLDMAGYTMDDLEALANTY